jgi:hypothetical protein
LRYKSNIFVVPNFFLPLSDADFFGWTPETEDGTDTTGDTITLPKLREKYQRLKAAGVLPQDKMDGSSGLGTKKIAKAKGILADKKAPH